MQSRPHDGLSLPDLHPALARYQAKLQELAKPAWLLRCSKADDVSRLHTHVGGNTPYAPIRDGWPECDQCGEPLTFVWQVDFADFQGAATFAEKGLFQFFYCWACFAMPVEDNGYECRWYPDYHVVKAQGVSQMDAPYEIKDIFEAVAALETTIVPFLSVPARSDPKCPISEEAQNEMVGEDGRLWSIYDFTKGFFIDNEMISRVGGYPPWFQDQDETPNCPICQERMVFVAAIGSDDTGLVWGDSGYWYFFACNVTKECDGLAKPSMALQCH